MSKNSFGAKRVLTVGGQQYEMFAIEAVPGSEKLPYTHKVLLENLLQHCDGEAVTVAYLRATGRSEAPCTRLGATGNSAYRALPKWYDDSC